jgi:hypothetical protein
VARGKIQEFQEEEEKSAREEQGDGWIQGGIEKNKE